jgi:hypothetical protein
MSRHLFAAAESAAAAQNLQYRVLVDIGVTSGTLYACNGNQWIPATGTYTLGNTYAPTNGYGQVEPIEDDADTTPRTVRLTLQMVGSASMYEPLREDMFNRTVTIRRAYLDPMTNLLVSTPQIMWEGFVNKTEGYFDDPERGNYFEVECESALRRKAEAVNFNKETHHTVLAQSGDTFFSHIHEVPLSKAMWGNQPTGFVGQILTDLRNRAGRRFGR